MSGFISEHCPNCGASEVAFNLICNYCGSKLERKKETLVIATTGYRCPDCHSDNLESSDFCQQCGSPIKKKCPFCLTTHHISAIFCTKSGYNIKEWEEKKRKAEEKQFQVEDKKKTRVDVRNILEKTIESEKRKR
ncbi:MAG: Double zinc ribbon [bacterium ADurb.Bin363]|nr:MAG: Double zinc ribbon [bacterium ADurb.Bin363]